MNIVSSLDQEDAKALLHHVLPKAKYANVDVTAVTAADVQVEAAANAFQAVKVQVRAANVTAKSAQDAAAVAAAAAPARGWCRHVPCQVC